MDVGNWLRPGQVGIRRLTVCHVTVPGDGVRSLLVIVCGSGITGAAVHEMHFGEALGSTTGWVNMRRPKILGNLQGLLNRKIGKVLPTEGYDLFFGNESSQLVLAGVVELAELDASNLGANVGREILDFATFQEVWE